MGTKVIWIWLVQFAHLAYRLRGETEEAYQKRVLEHLTKEGWKDIVFIQHAGTQALLAKKGNKVVISFRGTEAENMDVRSDLRGWKTKAPIGRVHAGAKDALDRIWLKLKDEVLERACEPEDKVFITGHSLGGMLANICASYLVDEAIKVGGLVTYGTPPTGNLVFARIMGYLMRSKSYRVVNQSDYVPRLVIQKLLAYFHFGQLVYIDSYGNIECCPSFFRRMYDTHKRPCRAIYNHAIRRYRSALLGQEVKYEETS